MWVLIWTVFHRLKHVEPLRRLLDGLANQASTVRQMAGAQISILVLIIHGGAPSGSTPLAEIQPWIPFLRELEDIMTRARIDAAVAAEDEYVQATVVEMSDRHAWLYCAAFLKVLDAMDKGEGKLSGDAWDV